MYSLEELKQQNQEIAHLCDVLSVLIDKPQLQNNPYVDELMNRFKERVWMHLVFEDKTIYASLLHTGDEKTSTIAKTFHASAKEIKRRFSVFVRHWCAKPLAADEYNDLCDESLEIINLIRDRINYENEQMFPLVE